MIPEVTNYVFFVTVLLCSLGENLALRFVDFVKLFLVFFVEL